MTVIAWDGKTLAADRRCTSGGLPRTTCKIRRINGQLVGASGDAADAARLMWWIEKGCDASTYPLNERDPSAIALVIMPDGRKFMFEGPIPIEFHDPVIAVGSGRDYAMAAMHCGKTAREAVEIACLFDVNCGNGIDDLELEA